MSRITFVQAPAKPVHLIARNPIYRALGRKPIAKDKWTGLSLDARLAFQRVQIGAGTLDDRVTLACTVNVSMVLAEKHCTNEVLGTTLAARDAIGRADARMAQGKAYNFDGPGRLEMLRVLDVHDQLIAELGQAAITDSILEMRQRKARGHVVGGNT